MMTKVTPEMIAAGVDELRDKTFGHSSETIVEEVYWAMWTAQHPGPSALEMIETVFRSYNRKPLNVSKKTP